MVDAARAGDPAAWRALYARHATALLAWLASLPHTDSAFDAEDVAAEAWMTAAGKIGEYSGDDAGFGGWLFTIARNHTLNSNRKAARRATDATDFTDHSDQAGISGREMDPATLVTSAARARELLTHLSEQEAVVVAARDVAGLSVGDTADLLDISTVSVRVSHHRALGKLRRILAQAPDVGPAPA